MRIGSLCSGVGGLDRAVEAFYGATTAWFCEYDDAPSRVLAHHWPTVPNHGDVKQTDWSAVEPVDILTAGYPCQPFSHAGKRKGADDPRHLWPGVARAISCLRPRVVVLENVRGHVSLGLDAVLGDLSRLGYDARWGVVRAADAGAAHGRARIFIVARNAGHGARGAQHGKQQSQRPRRSVESGSDVASDAVGEQRSGVAAAGSGKPNVGDGGGRVATDPNGERLPQSEPEPWGTEPGFGGDAGVGTLASGKGRSVIADASGDGRHEGWPESAGIEGRPDAALSGDTPTDTDCSGCETCSGRQGSGDARRREPVERGITDWGVYGPAIRRWEHVIGRAAPEPTEPGRNGPRLSPRFVEWLMGLNDGHVTDPAIGLTRNQQLKALGNGVVPQQAHLALTLLTSLEASRVVA